MTDTNDNLFEIFYALGVAQYVCVCMLLRTGLWSIYELLGGGIKTSNSDPSET